MAKKPIDFNKLFKKVAIVYGAIFLVGIILTCIFGAKLDINFRGGTVISYSYTTNEEIADIDPQNVKDLASEVFSTDSTVTKGAAISADSYTLTVSLVKNEGITTEALENFTKSLTEKYPDNSVELYSSTSVSPTLAGAFFLKSLVAVLVTSILVVIYIGFRFRKIGGITAALTALVALVLDVLVSFFVCVIFRLQIDSNYIAVVLTLLGYSLNDTIVVYDRVRENKKMFPELSLAENVNLSLNKCMTRNIVTSVTTVMAVLTIVVVAEFCGLSSLRTFAIPMAFGLVSGCCSSLFIAAPLWVVWRKKLDAKKGAKVQA